MTVDERIKNFGYELVGHDGMTGLFRYENLDNNQRVCLVINPHGPKNSGIIYTETMSTKKNFLGKNTTMSIGMSLAECRAFLDKADEIRNGMK